MAFSKRAKSVETVERCLACEADGRGNQDSREKGAKSSKRKTSSTADERRFTRTGEGSLPVRLSLLYVGAAFPRLATSDPRDPLSVGSAK